MCRIIYDRVYLEIYLVINEFIIVLGGINW